MMGADYLSLPRTDPPEPISPAAQQAAESAAPVQALLDQRGATHGSFKDNGSYAQMLKCVMRESKGWSGATVKQKEALDMIATKLSRIMSGQPRHADHWIDIAGYATLAADESSG
jgi:Domain of unknown function (DUF6378)